ncbi:ABC transporter permease [Streptomyces sp. NPDC002285]
MAAIGLWYTISYFVLTPSRRFLLPPPHDVVRIGFLNPSNLTELMNALALSAQVAVTGFGIAIVAGMLLAIAMSQARWIERSLYPYAVILQTIPVLALAPLFGFWFGYGIASRVLVCALIALFPIIVNTLFGLRSASTAHHDLFTLHHATRQTRLRKLQLPAALPSIFAGLRISAGLAVIGAIVGDYFFRQSEPGIGALIDLYRSRLQTEQMFAAIITSSLFGIIIFWAIGYLARLVVGSWHPTS